MCCPCWLLHVSSNLDASPEVQALCAAGLASGFGVRCDIVSLLNQLVCLPPKLVKLICCQPCTFVERSCSRCQTHLAHPVPQHLVLQIGARGTDEWGAMYASSLRRSSVGTRKLRVKQGETGQPSPDRLPLLSRCPTASGVDMANAAQQAGHECRTLHCCLRLARRQVPCCP